MLYGTMVNDIRLLGCRLTLQQGQRVSLLRANNIPTLLGSTEYFARPADGQWAGGIEHSPEGFILIDEGEVTGLNESSDIGEE